MSTNSGHENERITSPGQEGESSLLGHVSEALVNELRFLLESRKLKKLRGLTASMFAADVADIIESFPASEREDLVQALKPVLNPEIIAFLEDHVRVEVVGYLGVRFLSQALKDLDSDDALQILEGISPTQQREILEVIPKQVRESFEQVLSLPEDCAGRLMQQEVVVAPPFWTVAQLLDHIKKLDSLPSPFFEVFVIDPKNKLIGCVPLQNILSAKENKKLSSLYSESQQVLPVMTTKKETAQFFHHYGLVSAPVVGEDQTLLGVVTADDVLDVLEEETEKEILNIAGVSDTDFFAPMLETFYRRLGWLMVGLLNSLVSVLVISQFTDSIKEMVSLAILMPVVSTMGGNAGTQVVTVAVRALSDRTLKKSNSGKAMLKEVVIGLFNGVLFGFILIGLAVAYYENLQLGVILASAMMFTMLWAAFAGVMLPIFLERLRFDPAIASGPLITATSDIMGYGLFLGLATLFLL